MTVPSWPATLPRPERRAWSSRRQDGRQARSADSGPPGYRRRFSSTARFTALQIDVTRAEKAVFDTFYDATTGAGSLPFTMPDYTTDGWKMLDADGAPILDDSGALVLLSAEELCLFAPEPPEVTHYGVRFVIAFQIAVLP